MHVFKIFCVFDVESQHEVDLEWCIAVGDEWFKRPEDYIFISVPRVRSHAFHSYKYALVTYLETLHGEGNKFIVSGYGPAIGSAILVYGLSFQENGLSKWQVCLPNYIEPCMYKFIKFFHMPCLQFISLWSTIFGVFTTLRAAVCLFSTTEKCSWGRMEQCQKKKCLQSWTQGQGMHVYANLGGKWVVGVGVSWDNGLLTHTRKRCKVQVTRGHSALFCWRKLPFYLDSQINQPTIA